MFKIHINPNDLGADENVEAFSLSKRGRQTYTILIVEPENFDSLIEWLFENTTGRFVFMGNSIIYFEKEEDAVSFRLVWGSKETAK